MSARRIFGQSTIDPLRLACLVVALAFGRPTAMSCADDVACADVAGQCGANLRDRYDVVVVGAGTGGASAAIQAARLGATVLLGPREGPSGWRSVVSTPEAGELALWQRKRSTWP